MSKRSKKVNKTVNFKLVISSLMAALLQLLLYYEHLIIKPKKDKLSDILECIDVYKENHKLNQYSLLGVAAQQSLNDTMMEDFAFDTHLDIHKDNADSKCVLAVLANQNELIFLQINRFHKVMKCQRKHSRIMKISI